MNYKDTLEFALSLDNNDPLKEYRKEFHIPKTTNGEECIYFCGNSLGLQPKTAKAALEQSQATLEDLLSGEREPKIKALDPLT